MGNITVIIPSYNRAHLIERTIPTYLQKGVKQIIVVDDCSPDNTSEVVANLMKSYPQIKYIRQPRNMRQPMANNRGLEEVETEWVYFGDDDSILVPGTIERLYDTAVKKKSDIVGARALYMHKGQDELPLEEALALNYKEADKITDIVDISKLKADFSLYISGPVKVPFCHACLLCKTSLATKVKFDPLYKGNAYREETDFIIGCAKEGAVIYYNADAVQFNLPANIATGGARGKSVWRYKRDMIVNNWRFLKKNWRFIRKKYDLPTGTIAMQVSFMWGFIARPLIRILKGQSVRSN